MTVGYRTILLVLLLLTGSLSAQYIPKPKNPDTGPQTNSDEFPSPAAKNSAPSNPQPEDSVETFKVDVNIVNLLFNVKDKRGSLVPNLAKDDFQIAEDGKSQSIKYFRSESNLPLTLGILIDTSLSQDAVLPMEKKVGADFLEQVLRDKDMAFVISFDVNVDLLQDFTNSKKLLRSAMDGTRINAAIGGGGPGVGQGPFPSARPKGTLLYDAAYLAANEKLSREVGRKAMILLTDGEDQGSQLTLRDALTAAQKADTIMYVLLISDSHVAFGNGEHDMKKLCEETGGRVIRVGNKIEKLRDAFDQISNELRSQYSLAYTPTNNKRDGSFRTIDIKSKEGYKIQARKGYYAPLQ